MREATKAKYDCFVLAYISNKQNGAAAAVTAGYAEKSAHVTAGKMLKIPYIKQEIASKLDNVRIKAEEKFNITLEQRLEWLQKAVSIGFRESADIQGNLKAENLQASISAIKELNVMLGTDSHAEVKPVKVFVGVQDAS